MKKRSVDILDKRVANRVRLEKEAPQLFQGFKDLMKAFYSKGAVSLKNKELMAVTASVALRCEGALIFHANNAMAAGASRQEVIEASTIGVEFGGGPSFVMVRDNLLRILDELGSGD